MVKVWKIMMVIVQVVNQLQQQIAVVAVAVADRETVVVEEMMTDLFGYLFSNNISMYFFILLQSLQIEEKKYYSIYYFTQLINSNKYNNIK